MSSLLLALVYAAFISLGLPDGLLGSAWPTMSQGFAVPVSYAGIVSMIIAGGTILSSLASDRVITRLGTGKTTFFSVLTTAIALFGFSLSHSFWQVCLWAVPYGLGAGSVDAALNNYVALHSTSRHMSWLHCFWGIGASTGPFIMGWSLSRGFAWNRGYQTVGVIQVVLCAVLLFSFPLWKETRAHNEASDERHVRLSLKNTASLAGAKAALIAFFCYCGLETTTGLWAASYLVLHRGVDPTTAASFASLFYLGITAGRFVAGFVTGTLGDERMVRLGQGVIAIGLLCLFLPLPGGIPLAGFVIIGVGCAPVYPSLLHATPAHFGAQYSQSIMGVQMASAYVGSTFLPPLFGRIASRIGIAFLPWYLLCFLVLMVFMTEHLAKTTRK
ncbi:MAG: MFS transporter [Sphaerochaeta sp.]|jgi:fucose permease|nr:MFS transporter [Sphaerochaeta sp.]MCI2045241.1 MFS transporter [Sphaerochaeta sp.]MCI2075868.1 MFS transporter [Sphaerochaeta sp.]MCI2097134.1 MFS transporter [Sphaerochaeta sp.]MCI2104564.1 MFS transporter [Sphaerochaeta sp.]